MGFSRSGELKRSGRLKCRRSERIFVRSSFRVCSFRYFILGDVCLK